MHISVNNTLEAIRIDENGKASDMSYETIISADGCNPINRDEEMHMAYDSWNPVLPVFNPSALTGTVPGTYNGTIIPAGFPGANLYHTR